VQRCLLKEEAGVRQRLHKEEWGAMQLLHKKSFPIRIYALVRNERK
jgi:hypothetical protein